jgi:hypothetical protein
MQTASSTIGAEFQSSATATTHGITQLGAQLIFRSGLNHSCDKLFFIWSQEYWPQRRPLATANVTVPTALERAGDFSESLDLNGRLTMIRDP